MKKIIATLLLAIFVLGVLVGCGNSVVFPETSITWSDNETITYNVRLASDYEMTYIGFYARQKDSDGNYTYSSNQDQIAPSEINNGTYTTKITRMTEEGMTNCYVLETELSIVEVYDDVAFIKAGVTDLTTVKSRLNDIYDNELSTDDRTVPAFQKYDDKFVFNTHVSTRTVFNGTTMLPLESERTVCGLYVGKSGCAFNHFKTDVTYNYEKKRPVAEMTTVFYNTSAKTDSTVRLKNSDTVKTYDNEQLFLLMRSFDTDALFSNGSTSVNLVEGTYTKGGVTVNLYASSAMRDLQDFKIGAVWGGDVDASLNTEETTDPFNDKNGLCRYLNDGTNFTDAKGNLLNVANRNVFMLYVRPTAGLNMLAIFDNQTDKIIAGKKRRLLRAQQGYFVFDLAEESRWVLEQ